jgi:hypothetical protein
MRARRRASPRLHARSDQTPSAVDKKSHTPYLAIAAEVISTWAAYA